ncbi:inorganic triphosphatase [Trabulsiella odontotermitis]|uniref:Adenylate cyclase n=1 Tax=Trabulsiella odontotermitis TaxID=379893 RepID=A0A0L0GRI8_9ENTR|nr:inorganic triphosphatase [Trabulsiella odontotermitis]KNC91386.1 hypothetical protein GM31_02115 [Trabulsiella odontotermitis]
MAQEIELKFIVAGEGVETLRQHLNTLTTEHHPAVELLNIYYETADNWLRSHDMGLRIRGVQGRYEMTMKIAGRVVGGLHQRPEYNIDLDKPELALDRFPADVWPDGEQPADLASRVQPLFSTNFEREKWLVNEGDSRIEIALDRGEVKAGEHHEPICELEMELLSGRTEDVLKLSRQLVGLAVLRQGSLSKAARGYHLAKGNAERDVQSLDVLPLPAKANVEQAMVSALENALAHWQYHEELWIRGNDNARPEIMSAIARIRHALTLFGGLVPRKASARLRDQLTLAEATLASAVSAQTAAYDAQTAQAKLTLTEWLVLRGWQPFIDEKTQPKLADSFKRFADVQLSRVAAELKKTFANRLGDRYTDQLPRLARDIDSVMLLAGYYPDVAVQAWLEPWQGLSQSIARRQHNDIEIFRNEALNAEPFWLHSGKR